MTRFAAFVVVDLMLVMTPGADWAYAITAGVRSGKLLPAIAGLVGGYVVQAPPIASSCRQSPCLNHRHAKPRPGPGFPAADAQPREFLGIPFDLLATGDRLMITRMRYQTGMAVATRAHEHEHEQGGYIISGRCRQTAAGVVTNLGPGDSYVIAGGIQHTIDVLEGGHVIDVFPPPRVDYR